MALSSEKETGANLGQSAGARAIEARAAIATAQLRSTVTSISSEVGCTSPHGERIVETIDGLIDDVMPELEAAEALTSSGRGAAGGSAPRPSLWVDTESTVGASS
ncbi:hypothetical protein ACXYTP_20205 [Tsukamurella ocularis]|uniref:hypothetical protein n=1 Tax=Tsukamurella ocularis TaxID=1970234 RepID=UPI0039EF882A